MSKSGTSANLFDKQTLCAAKSANVIVIVGSAKIGANTVIRGASQQHRQQDGFSFKS
jgi:hypothetical protein